MVLPAAAAVLTLSVAGYVYLHRASTLTEKDTIVLADFENRTGDPVFDVRGRRAGPLAKWISASASLPFGGAVLAHPMVMLDAEPPRRDGKVSA